MALSINSPCNPCSPCYGPVITGVAGSLRSAAPLLEGFLEFGSLSSPPVLYTSYSISGTLKTTWHDSVGSPHDGSNECDGEGPVTISGCGNDVTFITVDGVSSTTESGNKFCGGCGGSLAIIHSNASDGDVPSVASGDVSGPGINNASEGTPATLLGSGDSATVTVSATSFTSGTITYTVEAGTLIIALFDPDTASDALGRASFSDFTTESDDPTDYYGFSDGFFSLYETRADITGPAFHFGYQDGTYQISADNLISGHNYQITVQWEEETAEGDGSGNTTLYGGSFSDADTDVIDFTASGTTYTTSSQTIPVTTGYLKRIKTIIIVEV